MSGSGETQYAASSAFADAIAFCESEADAGPEKLDDAKSIIEQANQALEGMGDLLSNQAAKIGSRGTFLASNVLGLQAGGVSDRMANGIDKIERNTRSLRNAQELSFT